MNKAGSLLFVVIVLAVGLGIGFWIAQTNVTPPAVVDEIANEPADASQDEAVDATPRHPMPTAAAEEEKERKLVPLPPLDDSDSYFLLALTDIFGPDVESKLVNDDLVDKFVTTVDNLSRGHIAKKIRPAGRLASSFAAVPGDVEGEYLLLAENVARYDELVTLFSDADAAAIADTYRRFYPLLQQAYRRLGYPEGYFNDRMIEVIDHLLTTPEPAGPIRLVRPHVLYEFADPDLEALSSGQKLLLRMGAAHTVTVKLKLTELRNLITTPAGKED